MLYVFLFGFLLGFTVKLCWCRMPEPPRHANRRARTLTIRRKHPHLKVVKAVILNAFDQVGQTLL